MTAFRFVKPTLLSALLVLSPVTTAFAETVEVMILNTRGEDGIYRPALRVLRGSTVTFIPVGSQGLTEAILRDRGQLGEWLSSTITSDDPTETITFTLTEIRAEPAGGKICFPVVAGQECDRDEFIAFCSRSFPGETGFDRWNEAPTLRDYCFD